MDAKVEGQLYRRLISKVVEALTDGRCMTVVMIITVASLSDGRVEGLSCHGRRIFFVPGCEAVPQCTGMTDCRLTITLSNREVPVSVTTSDRMNPLLAS